MKENYTTILNYPINTPVKIDSRHTNGIGLVIGYAFNSHNEIVLKVQTIEDINNKPEVLWFHSSLLTKLSDLV